MSRRAGTIHNQSVDYSIGRDLKFNRMVERAAGRLADADPRVLDRIFRALGDRTRRDMLRRLADGDRTVGELAEPCDMSLAAASKHVRVLERAGLVRRTIRGRTHHCRLAPGRLSEAQRWLAFYQRFWTARFDALDRMLTADRPARPARGPR
jgi:DNA-binding transcriptional ArsR family regulator